jgi:hypothetical protein
MNIVKDGQWCFKCPAPPDELSRLTADHGKRTTEGTRALIKQAYDLRQAPVLEYYDGIYDLIYEVIYEVIYDPLTTSYMTSYFQDGANMTTVKLLLKPHGLHFRTTVLWNILDFDAHSGFPYEVLHNMEKGMIEWILAFLGTLDVTSRRPTSDL